MPLMNLTSLPDDLFHPLTQWLEVLQMVQFAAIAPVNSTPKLLMLKIWRSGSGLSEHYLPLELFSNIHPEEFVPALERLIDPMHAPS